MGLYDVLFRRPARPTVDALRGSAAVVEPPSGSLAPPRRIDADQGGMTAAAAPISDAQKKAYSPNNAGWQAEAWEFYDTLGEFRYGVDWRAEMVSRVRLRAGRKMPGQDEPELLDDGVAAELIDQLIASSDGGPDQLMRSFATQLGVPGECWLTGETDDDGAEHWRVRSSDEIRKARKPGITWEVLDDQASFGGQDSWRDLPADALVHRVWEPHPRKFHLPDSPARAARGVMRELDLVNRHIQAIHLSRLASRGMILIPDEIDFPVRKEFEDKYNRVVLEFIETAKTAVQTQGSAASMIPIPFVASAEYLDKIQFIDFTSKQDQNLLEKRDSAIRRLATQLDLPAEVLLGMGDVNHWSAWQLEESGVKVHILPMVERICYALLVGYLIPRLKASGEYDPDLVVWYDASEITMRPDRSEAATKAYADMVITQEAYRREIGMDEGDEPTDDELERIVLLRLAADPASAATALKALTGLELEAVATTPAQEQAVNPQTGPEATGQEQGPPETQNTPPPAPNEQQAARAKLLDFGSQPGLADKLQVQLDRSDRAKTEMRHWFTRSMDGVSIVHPAGCTDIGTRCPYQAALIAGSPRSMPGTKGTYEVTLVGGRLRVGARRQDSAYAHHRA